MIKKYFDIEEKLCEIEATLIKIKSAKNPGYLHSLNDTPEKENDSSQQSISIRPRSPLDPPRPK